MTSSVRNSRRLRWNGRRFAVNILFLLTVSLAVGGVGFGVLTASAENGAQRHYGQVTVAAGDTLWDIAGRLPVRGDRRDTVERIRQLNRLGTRSIYVGEVLRVPAD
ncbi:MAG: LysM peptidoglycan-binding domain-containing protein [Bacillota bacterium]